jgi:hypothetical protein
VVLDSVAIGAGQGRAFTHRHPPVLEDDAEQFFREGRQRWHEPLSFNLPLEDLLLPHETPEENGQVFGWNWMDHRMETFMKQGEV